MTENSQITLIRENSLDNKVELTEKTKIFRAARANNRWKSLVFEYSISTKFYRQHSNPPLWRDYHYHDFQVTLQLKSVCNQQDLYGVNMIEAQQILDSVDRKKNKSEIL